MWTIWCQPCCCVTTSRTASTCADPPPSPPSPLRSTQPDSVECLKLLLWHREGRVCGPSGVNHAAVSHGIKLRKFSPPPPPGGIPFPLRFTQLARMWCLTLLMWHRGGRGCGPSGVNHAAVPQHLPRHQPAQVPAPAIPVLPGPDRAVHVPPVQQLPVPGLPPQPLPHLLCPRPLHQPVHG